MADDRLGAQVQLLTQSPADPRSAAAQTYRRWYRTSRWRRLRAQQLGREPWCCMCRQMGRATPAAIVDHQRPHRGDPALFWDPANLASLCAPHHDATKQRAERGGRTTVPVDADGWPVGGLETASGAPTNRYAHSCAVPRN